MPSDFDQIASMPPGGQDPIPEMENLKQALSGMRDLQSRLVVQNQQAEQPLPPQSIQVNTAKGTVTMKDLPIATYEAFNRDRQQLNEIRGAFHQEAERLKAQQERAAAQPPWVQLATALSANLASQKDMPGWVRGLGQTAAQLNPRPEEIQARRFGVMEEEAKLAEKAGALDLEQIREKRLADDETRKIREDKARDTRSLRTGLITAAQKGELTDASLTSQLLQDGGVSKEKADVQAKALVGVSQEKKSLLDAAAAATEKRASDHLKEMARESDNRLAVMLKGLSVKTSDQSDAKKAIEETAQSIAKGDLSSIKDISSFRGSERTKIYARAKEINPNFSVAETKRKIDMEQSFTVGKDGQSLQSFGTFLEHAGEASEALKGLYQSGSPALNKPMNWLRKNAAGNPEYQRLIVSLEPVGKEFESFLLNQRALYVDDRKQIDTMLNGNSSPAQIMTALNQMGKTAKDRYSEMNQRYKRVMKQDIQDPFGPEAIAGAAKVGISLPSGGSSKAEAKKYPWE